MMASSAAPTKPLVSSSISKSGSQPPPRSVPRSSAVALIVAATVGSRLFPLTSEDSPKHVLPLCGVAVLERLLVALHASGFELAIVATGSKDTATRSFLMKCQACQQISEDRFLFQKTVEISTVNLSNDCSGTVQAVREVSDSGVIPEESHLVVLPGDLVAIQPNAFAKLVSSHRASTSGPPEWSVTIALTDLSEEDEQGVPLKESAKAKKNLLTREDVDIEYIALAYDRNLIGRSDDPTSTVVWKQPIVDVEEDFDMVGKSPQLVLPKHIFRAASNIRVRTTWADVHAYVVGPDLRRWIVGEQCQAVSFQGDLLPLLVHHARPRALESQGGPPLPPSSFAKAVVLDEPVLLRVSTVAAFMFASRELLTAGAATSNSNQPSTGGSAAKETAGESVFPMGSVVNTKQVFVKLPGVQVGEKVQCKLSIIGFDSKIGHRCRLNNVVVFDGVTIGDGCIIQNTVLGRGCTIGDGSNLNDCVVGAGKAVEPNTKEKGETFTD